MSQYLLDAVTAHLRAAFTRSQVPTVQAYAGEFSAAEVDRLSFTAPALLPTVLGWQPEPRPSRLSGRNVRAVRMALFIVAKHAASRQARMAQAMALAEMASISLRQWVPEHADQPVLLGTLQAEPTCENLYGRAIDREGLALWLLSWDQECKPLIPLPQLYDLTAIEIIDTTRQGIAPPPPPPPNPAPLLVTEQVDYAPLP